MQAALHVQGNIVSAKRIHQTRKEHTLNGSEASLLCKGLTISALPADQAIAQAPIEPFPPLCTVLSDDMPPLAGTARHALHWAKAKVPVLTSRSAKRIKLQTGRYATLPMRLKMPTDAM